MTQFHNRVPSATRMQGALAVLIGLAACAAPQHLEPAAEGPCPSWVQEPIQGHANAASLHLGCSNVANLAATIEDAADLQRGRALAPASGAHESLGIARYQTGQVPPLQASAPATPTIVFSGSGGGTGGSQ